jgi:glycosyltransferase involved in cell wall biosynthesis
MGAGNCVVVSDIAYNTEAVGRAGVTFRNKDAADLREKLQSLVDDPAAVRAHGRRAVARVREAYDWETVADTYETLFHGMAARKRKVVETQQG